VLYRVADRLGSDLLAEVDRKMQVNRLRKWHLDGTGHGTTFGTNGRTTKFQAHLESWRVHLVCAGLEPIPSSVSEEFVHPDAPVGRVICRRVRPVNALICTACEVN